MDYSIISMTFKTKKEGTFYANAYLSRKGRLMSIRLKILIVDDEINIRKTLAIALEAEKHSVTAVSNIKDALSENSASKFDMCFLDMRLGISSGLDLLPKLLEASPWLKVVIITAHGTIDNAVEAMRLGAFDYVEKPFSASEIFGATRKVETVLILEEKIRELELEIANGKPEMEIRSHSLIMRKVMDIARSAAPTDATVLISGENGTGKTMIAKAIHNWSPRGKKPFVVVSCPSLSAELLESELFGHSKGAFTGAFKSNPGRIEACEGGTLFLDEIGDMPLSLQSKLLRFLQERQYERVGDNTTRKADVRVVAATHVKLKEAVKAGRFREDLYYRLNVIEIVMPALRNRIEDIEPLADRFLASLRHDKKINGFSKTAMDKMKSYDWPGNIRELRNIIERAIIICHGDMIEGKDLSMDEPKSDFANTFDQNQMGTLEQIEEQHIRRVLASTRSMDQAAQVLGIDSTTLWRKRKRYAL